MAFQINITEEATTQDTVNAIISVIKHDSQQGFIPQLATALNPNGSKFEYIKRLFDLVCENITYEADPPGWEKVFTGTKLFREGKGDCKKMTTAIAAVLKAAGIEPLLKVISYDDKKWSHIYVLAKINQRYYTLDPVNNKKFDTEINHKRAAVFNLLGKFELMPGTKLSILGNDSSSDSIIKGWGEGIDELSGDLDRSSSAVGNIVGMGAQCTMCGTDTDELVDFFDKSGNLSGMGKKKLKEKLKKILDKVKKGTAKIALAPMRGAFLGILLLGKALEKTPIKINLPKKMAEHWQKDGGKKLSDVWAKFGGKPDELKKTIAKGSGTTLSGIEANGDLNIAGIGVVALATIGAAITAAAPILIAIQKALKEAGIIKEGEDKGLQDTNEAAVDAYDDKGDPPANAAAAAAAAAGGCAATGDLNSFFMAALFFVVTFLIIKLINFIKHEIQLERSRNRCC